MTTAANQDPSSENSTVNTVPVHVDGKGRLSVDVRELQKSAAFKKNLRLMVKLAERHSPASR